MASRVVHFEIHADDPTRAMSFYQSMFGWKFMKFPGPVEYWLATTGPDSEPGINGGILPRKAKNTSDSIVAFICTVQVDDLDASIAQAATLGCGLCLDKMAIPGVGWLAYIKDTEGNIVGLTQPDPTAK